jgi:hypothetical protein
MIVGAACLAVFAVSFWVRTAARNRPLEAHEVHRIRRLSEKLQREAWLPFE